MTSVPMLLRSFFAAVFAIAALGLLPTSPAQARPRADAPGRVRLNGGVWLGFGGDAQWDGDGDFAGDLETTVGGQFGVDAVVNRHLSLGGEARFGAVKWKVGDRNKLIDLDFKPRLRFPLRDAPLEFYFTVPVGITVPRLSDYPEGTPPHDAKLGWNLGVGGGMNVFLTRSFGLNAEPMWIMHRFKVKGESDGEYTLKQFGLFLNAVVAF